MQQHIWGGILLNPGTKLTHALATLIGRLLVKELSPPPVSAWVANALADVELIQMPILQKLISTGENVHSVQRYVF